MYCIVETATGLSQGFVDCPPQLLAANTPLGCQAIAAEGVEVGNYLLEADRLIPIGEAPSPQHAYQRGKGWVLEVDTADPWVAVRRQRDEWLTASDWRVVRAAEMGSVLGSDWMAYRQALRDLTTQPYPPAWPKAPIEGVNE